MNILWKGVVLLGGSLLLSACSSMDTPPCPTYEGPGTQSPIRATSRPYYVRGQWHHPQPHYELEQIGMASYYGDRDCFHGRPTSTGERFDRNGLTAAHKTLPLPCVVLVTNLENGRFLKLRVNDRGPFIKNRILDVSAHAASLLGFYRKGTARVRVQTLVDESFNLPENQYALLKQSGKRNNFRLATKNKTTNSKRFANISKDKKSSPSIRFVKATPFHPTIQNLVDTVLLSQAPKKVVSKRARRGIYVQLPNGRLKTYADLSHANHALNQLISQGHTNVRLVIK